MLLNKNYLLNNLNQLIKDIPKRRQNCFINNLVDNQVERQWRMVGRQKSKLITECLAPWDPHNG